MNAEQSCIESGKQKIGVQGFGAGRFGYIYQRRSFEDTKNERR